MSRSIPSIPPALLNSQGLRRGFGLASLACLLLVVLSIGGPAAIAQDDSNATYWLKERARQRALHPPPPPHPRVIQRPTHLIRHAAPVRGFAREVPAGASGSLAAPTQPAAAGNAATPAPLGAAASGKPASGTFMVVVMGDSLGQLLAQGLRQAFADKPEVVVSSEAHQNSGLVRNDYFDWVKAARDLLAGHKKINVGVMMVGSNDRQPIRDGSAIVDLHTPRWKELYAARVAAIADMFRDKKIPLIWVGLPIMKSERLSADFVEFNEIYREAAAKAGATYVDTWEAFADDRGQYTAYGPDISGQFVKLRTSDGIHFTRAGARTLAHFVENDIRRDEQLALPPLDAAVAALESHGTPAAQPGQTQTHGWLAGVPVPAPPPAVVIRVKPAVGPIVPLNAPAVSTNGKLAKMTPAAAPYSNAQALVDKALVEGRPLAAQPGRTDDFRWPHH